MRTMMNWSRTKSRVILPAVGGLTLLGLGSLAIAKPPADARGGGHHRGGLCAALECTDAQRDEIRAVRSELRADSKADREAIKRLRKELAAEFAKAKPDEAAMRSTQARIDDHRRELRERGFDAMMEIHALLTPAQRVQLAAVMERRGMKGLMRGGKGGKRGKGDKRGKKSPRGGEGERRAG